MFHNVSLHGTQVSLGIGCPLLVLTLISYGLAQMLLPPSRSWETLLSALNFHFLPSALSFSQNNLFLKISSFWILFVCCFLFPVHNTSQHLKQSSYFLSPCVRITSYKSHLLWHGKFFKRKNKIKCSSSVQHSWHVVLNFACSGCLINIVMSCIMTFHAMKSQAREWAHNFIQKLKDCQLVMLWYHQSVIHHLLV